MTVTYKRLPASLSADRELVSEAQYRLLLACEPDLPAAFDVNEGKRTKARQEELVREKGIYNRATNPYGAAAYSPQAPHIKEGRSDHALDCDLPGALVTAARKRDVTYRYTVPTEGWHIEPDPGELAAFAGRARKRRRGAIKAARVAVRRATRGVVRARKKLGNARRRLVRAKR